MKTLKNLDTLKNERIIVELDRTAQKNIIGGFDVESGTYPTRDTEISGTYFDHDFIEE